MMCMPFGCSLLPSAKTIWIWAHERVFLVLDPAALEEIFIVSVARAGDELAVTRTENHKCGRCWRHLPEVTEDGALCNRCDTVLDAA